MNVPAQKPFLLYCQECGEQGRFHGADDREIAVHLEGSGWLARPEAGGKLTVQCPMCHVEELRKLALAHRADSKPADGEGRMVWQAPCTHAECRARPGV